MMENSLSQFDGILLDGLEFCKRAYALFEDIQLLPDGVNRLRLRLSNTERKLMGEILPICKYIHSRYRVGRYISVRWIDGDQSFDAELHQCGGYIDRGYYPELAYLEVTSAMHENEHWIWHLLANGRPAFAPEGITKQKGMQVTSEAVTFSKTEHVENFISIVLEQMEKKAKIPYPPNTSLIVQCNLNNLYIQSDWETLVREVKHRMPESQFFEILLYDTMCDHTSTVYKRKS